MGTIQVETNPTGAKVLLDGLDTGRITNCLLSDIEPGNHFLKLIKEGYNDTELSITVTGGVTTPVYVNFTAHNITIIKPRSGTTWIMGEEVEISWQTENLARANENMLPLTLSNVKIELFKGSSLVRTIVSSTENDGTFGWTVPEDLEIGSNYKVKISCADDANIYKLSDSFRIDRKSIEILKPNRNTVWTIGNTAEIEWLNTGTIDKVRIELYRGTPLLWSYVRTIVSSTNNDGSFSWIVDPSLQPANNYMVGIICIGEENIKSLSETFSIQGNTVTKRYYSNDTPIVVWEATSETSTITVRDSGIITNVKYRLFIREYWTDDLNVTLKHNNVQTFVRNEDTPTIYTRTTEKFNGMQVKGDWDMFVRLSDLAFPSNYLDSWWIEITFIQN